MRNIQYRIISAMFAKGVQFRVEYMDMDAPLTRPWGTISDPKRFEWYDSIKEAKKAIKIHKRISNYVPQIIYVN